MRMPHGHQPLRAPLEDARGLIRRSEFIYQLLRFLYSFFVECRTNQSFFLSYLKCFLDALLRQE